jgi:hypothetical protein
MLEQTKEVNGFKCTLHNAQINKTHLGAEDHGIFTFYIDLKLDSGWSQSIGGYALDDVKNYPLTNQTKRVGSAAGMDLIMKIIRTIGISKWEDLPKQYIRVYSHDGGIESIYNLMDDTKHVNIREHFANFKE